MLFAIRQAVDLVRRRFASLHTLTPPNIRKRTILRLEPLEGRCVPAAFTVTTLNGSGDGSLRTAIANADGSLDDSATISFAAGLSGTINLGSDLTTLGKNITISGPSSGIGITVNGGDSFHPFTVAAGKTCEIDNLDITHGLSVGGFGGAITNNGALALSGCQITWNHAQSGGGIANMQGAVLDLKNNTYVSNNTADNFGGGICNFGSEVTMLC